jgi:fibrillarin-like rRNA methylase
VTFVASNETQAGLFNDYVKYFLEKGRAGVVSLKKHCLYILPPCEEAFKIRKFNEKEMLGVFVDINDADGTKIFSQLTN